MKTEDKTLQYCLYLWVGIPCCSVLYFSKILHVCKHAIPPETVHEYHMKMITFQYIWMVQSEKATESMYDNLYFPEPQQVVDTMHYIYHTKIFVAEAYWWFFVSSFSYMGSLADEASAQYVLLCIVICCGGRILNLHRGYSRITFEHHSSIRIRTETSTLHNIFCLSNSGSGTIQDARGREG